METHIFGTSKIICDKISIGSNFKIGENSVIKTSNFIVGDYVSIGDNNKITVANEVVIGNCSTFLNNNDIFCFNFIVGEYVWWDSSVIVGLGGKFSHLSRVEVGSYSMIHKYALINCSDSVTIGKNVGIGDVQIWTHGSWLPVLDGFPADFGPVTIGNNVWLASRSVVLPNITIQDNVVIGINTLVNKNIKSGCLAAGVPVKIIKENAYPKVLSIEDKKNIVENIIQDYKNLAQFKGILDKITIKLDENIIHFNECVFDLGSMKIKGTIDSIVEDFRDYLRRRGIKFFTGLPFKSIIAPAFKKVMEC